MKFLFLNFFVTKFVFITTVISITTVTTFTTVITVNTVNNVNIVNTVNTIIVKYQMLLLYSAKGNFFTKSPDRQTDRPTTRLLELLGAAKQFCWYFVFLNNIIWLKAK